MQQVPINVVGSSTFGRYPKISLSKTYNMFISDDWLVNYAGYRKELELLKNGKGRGLYYSVRGGFMIAVISSSLFKIGENLVPVYIGQIDTTTGSVSIDENLASQICIVDSENAYIYNYNNNIITKQNITYEGNTVLPSYVCYHNSFFLIGSSPKSVNSQDWYACDFATENTIKVKTQMSLQTKPDSALLVKRLPGKGNNVLVLGSTVGEVWTQVGGVENYRRVQSFNIDNGTVSTATLAANDEYVCWLAQNESNSPFIMVSNGSEAKRISSDGIDYVLSLIRYPNQSSAFFYRQDGHLFYHITFYNEEDNLTLIYDFTTQKFFHASDENLHYYPALQSVFFFGAIYFVSINDGGLYLMDTNILTYDYEVSTSSVGNEIPRIRICDTIRQPDSSVFRVNNFVMWIEQGVFSVSTPQPNPPVKSQVDMSYSKNGNQSFSNVVSRQLNDEGKHRNKLRFWRMGQANEFTIQLRFTGFQRFCVNQGILEIY